MKMNDTQRCLWRRAVATWALVAGALIVFSVDARGQAMPEAMPSAKSMMDWGRVSFILFDELEYVPGDKGRPISFEGLGWYGGAYNRLWFRTEGEQNTAGGGGAAEVEFLFGRLISPYWYAVTGLRYDRRGDERNDGRALYAVGLRTDREPALVRRRGGEGGIRTHEADHSAHTLSKRAP